MMHIFSLLKETRGRTGVYFRRRPRVNSPHEPAKIFLPPRGPAPSYRTAADEPERGGAVGFLTAVAGRRYHRFAMSGIPSEPKELGMRSARKECLVEAAAGAMEDRE
jgi:hypothetical protein